MTIVREDPVGNSSAETGQGDLQASCRAMKAILKWKGLATTQQQDPAATSTSAPCSPTKSAVIVGDQSSDCEEQDVTNGDSSPKARRRRRRTRKEVEEESTVAEKRIREEATEGHRDDEHPTKGKRKLGFSQPFHLTRENLAYSPTSSEENIVIDEDAEESGVVGMTLVDVKASMIVGEEVCGWCQRKGAAAAAGGQFSMRTEGKSFCSERCFSLFRRAAFKKSRVCDWCRKAGPPNQSLLTLATDKDKNAQLQFCNDQCLSQFKMDLFCRETRAQLALHPQLKHFLSASSSVGGDGTGSVLKSMAAASAEFWLARHHAEFQHRLRATEEGGNERSKEEQQGNNCTKRSSNPSSDEDSSNKKKPMVKVKPDHLLKAYHHHQRPSSSSRERSGRRSLMAARTTRTPPLSLSKATPPPPRVHRASHPQVAGQNLLLPPPLLLQQQRDARPLFPLAAFNGLLPPPLTPAPLVANGGHHHHHQQHHQQPVPLIPPATMILPMPVFIPFPIPILIPVPRENFYKDENANISSDLKNNGSAAAGGKEASMDAVVATLDLSMKTVKGNSDVETTSQIVKAESAAAATEEDEESNAQTRSSPRPSSNSGGEDASSEQRRRRRALIMDVPSSNVLNKRQRE